MHLLIRMPGVIDGPIPLWAQAMGYLSVIGGQVFGGYQVVLQRPRATG